MMDALAMLLLLLLMMMMMMMMIVMVAMILSSPQVYIEECGRCGKIAERTDFVQGDASCH
jgi:small-conductance mechanosensitive channel